MKNINIFIFSVLMLTATAVGTAQTPALPSASDIKFQDLAMLVETRNATVLSAKAQIDAAKGRLGQSRAQLRPNISTKNSLSQNTQTSKGQGNIGSTTNNFSANENTVSLSQTLDLFGQNRATILQNAATVRQQEASYVATLNNQVALAESAYIELASAVALAQGAESDVTNAKQRLANTERRFAAGLVPELNVLQARADVASYESTLAVRRASANKARSRLGQQFGMEPDASAQLNPRLGVDPTRAEVAFSPLDAAALREETLRTHPRLVALNEQVGATQHGYENIKRSNKPGVSLSANYTINDTKSQFAFTRQGAVMLSFSMPMYDGGLRKSQLATQAANIEVAKRDLQSTQESIGSELWQAVEDYHANVSALASAREAYRSASEALRVSELRFREGVGTSGILEVQSAEAKLITARTQMIDAYYACLKGKVEVSRAMGKPGVANLEQ